MTSENKNSILIVDDEVTNINVLLHLLRENYTIYVAKNGDTAIEMARSHLPDLILLDIIMPGMDGYTVLRNLREIESTKNIPIIFITGLDGQEHEEYGLALEVADYIAKPFVSTIVKLRVNNQMRMVNYLRTIEHLSMTDALTGLSNRRRFNEKLQQEWGLAIREKLSLSLIILDVDNFKRYNDSYGHQQGDVVLITVAQIFNEILKRSTDFVARWGGEEFIILLPVTDSNGAVKVAERIREEIEKRDIPLEDGTITNVTISAGISEIVPDRDSEIDKFISAADEALYAAKDQGRNRVVVSE